MGAAAVVIGVGCTNTLTDAGGTNHDEGGAEAASVPGMRWSSIPGAGPHGALNDREGGGFYPQLAVFEGRVHATWYEQAGGVTRVRVAAAAETASGSEWRYLDAGPERGLNRDSSRRAIWSRLVVHDGRLFAYWHEEISEDAFTIRVARYNGDEAAPAWSYVGGPISQSSASDSGGAEPSMIAPGARSSDYASLASFRGGLYAAWRSSNGVAYQIRVARFNEDDSAPRWVLVDHGDAGINRDVSMDAYYPKLHVHADRLYAAWYERNGGARQLRTAVYNGDDGAPSWRLVDGNRGEGLNYASENDARGPQLLTHDGSLYAVWYEQDDANRGAVRVAAYNGDDASPRWRFVDGGTAAGLNRNPSGNAWWARAASSGSLLLVAWAERVAGPYRIHAAVTGGLSAPTTEPGWRSIDPDGGINLSAASTAEYPHAVSDGESFYLAWSERHDGVFRVFVRQATETSVFAEP